MGENLGADGTQRAAVCPICTSALPRFLNLITAKSILNILGDHILGDLFTVD